MITKNKVRTSLLLIIGILILINLLSIEYYFRFDFTEDQRYSLSDATVNILEELNDPITVTAYFSEDLPPDVARVRTDFKDLLIEYYNISKGNVVYEFKNPNENQETEMNAQQSGIRPIMINVRERDQMKQQRAYLGAVIQLGDRKEIIPFIEPGAAMEFALTSAVKKISTVEKPFVALLQGNGQPSKADMPQLMRELNVMYEVLELTLNDTTDIPIEINTVILAAPKDSADFQTLNKLNSFLERGGNMFIALNRVTGELQRQSGVIQNTLFEEWLAEKGVEVEEKFFIDVNCGNIMVQQNMGGFVMNSPVKFPYLPMITNFSDHPVTKGLEAVMLPFASPINIVPKDTSVSIIPIAYGSEKCSAEPAPVRFNIQKEWTAAEFTMSRLPVAVAVEGNLTGSANNKLVVIGDGDFFVNGQGQQAQKLQDDNVSLAANAIDWLSDDTGLVDLRTKSVTARVIDKDIEESTKNIIKYLNFLLPVILIIIYGIFRFQLKRKLRNQIRMVDYV